MSNFVAKCREANAIYLSNPQQSEYALAEILKMTFTEPSLLKRVGEEEYSIVGHSYLCLLDRMRDETFFQSLSSLGYYFSSLAINSKGLSDSYVDRILILNMGARTFYRTVALATGNNVYDYIDFNDFENLPIPVKYVLAMEYYDLFMLSQKMRLTQDILNRKNALESLISNGLFDSISERNAIIKKGEKVHQDVLQYLKNEIINNGIVFFK